MKKLKQGFARYLGEIALIAGCTAITVGAGMIYLPTGFIVGGILMAACAVLSFLGGGEDT